MTRRKARKPTLKPKPKRPAPPPPRSVEPEPERPFRVRLGRRLVRLSRPEAERVAGVLRRVEPVGDVSIHVRGRLHTMPARQAIRARRVLGLVLDMSPGGLP